MWPFELFYGRWARVKVVVNEGDAGVADREVKKIVGGFSLPFAIRGQVLAVKGGVHMAALDLDPLLAEPDGGFAKRTADIVQELPEIRITEVFKAGGSFVVQEGVEDIFIIVQPPDARFAWP